MKVYKLDIDVAQPTNQVVQMQQNTSGVLSVDVTNNGNYIRNLSCQMFDGETEISACSADDKGFKLNIGDTPKHYTVKATATPIECSATTYVGGSGQRQNRKVARFQLAPGVYHQDEFMPIAQKFTNNSGLLVAFYADAGALSACNFDRFGSMYTNNGIICQFYNTATQKMLSSDEDIVVTAPVEFYVNQYTFRTATTSSYTYPAIGYYVNYQADTLVKPSTNANAFSEIDVLPTEAEFKNLSADSFTLSGVTYVPTTLSVDGVAYTVLAAQAEEQNDGE